MRVTFGAFKRPVRRVGQAYRVGEWKSPAGAFVHGGRAGRRWEYSKNSLHYRVLGNRNGRHPDGNSHSSRLDNGGWDRK